MTLRIKDTHVMPHGEGLVVWFQLGEIVRPSNEALAAFKQLEGVMEAFAAERKAIQPWHGNLVLYAMTNLYPEADIKDEDVQSCITRAMEMYPKMRYATSWISRFNQLDGVSVQLIT